MPDLIFELLSEEVPARMQANAIATLQQRVEEQFEKSGLSYKKIEAYVTPRRMAILATGLPAKQESVTEEKRGPRVDAPQQAVDGFLKSTGLKRDQLEKRKTKKGEFFFAVVEQKGTETQSLLGDILAQAITNFPWPKSMRWGDYDCRWVRPLVNIACVFNGKAVPLTFAHLTANNLTYGHRFLKPDAIEITTIASYKNGLEKAYVMLDQEARKSFIIKEGEKLAKAKKLALHKDKALLEEVTGLVEWPVPLLGAIDSEFMKLPSEVLETSMREHQKYFTLRDKGGLMAPHFLTVANIVTKDKGRKIIAGNERVLRARLADARFFYEQDSKQSLEDFLPRLDTIVFHAKLGSIGDKTRRMADLAKLLAVWVPHADLLKSERAAMLSKADLATEMVGEFPELQGTMGYYYASEQEEDDIAHAIYEHYAPVGPSDDCPVKPLSIVTALADKIDSLVGLFAVGEIPTGSKDPFALRRAALGVIRIILDNKLAIPLNVLFSSALKQYPNAILKQDEETEAPLEEKKKRLRLKLRRKRKTQYNDVIEILMDFFEDRIKASLKSQKIRHDLISAVFDGGQEDDICRLVKRIESLHAFLETDDGANLLVAYRRAANILAKEEEKEGKSFKPSVSSSQLKEPQEKALHEFIEQHQKPIEEAIKQQEFTEAMQLLSGLRKPVDDFFDKVKVNADEDDIRKNRLCLLAAMRELFDAIANFDKVEG